MLTKLVIRNFKQFEDVEIPLASPVVFIGPNNSGKTTALQALALWELGLRRWKEKRASGAPEKRPGIAINRRDLLLPGRDAKQLWRQLRVRKATKNVRIDILVFGNTAGRDWECGLEFDFLNDESIFCRPLRGSDLPQSNRMAIPEDAKNVRVAFLPPMSGLGPSETRLTPGAINLRLGEGRTAEVLRNLCYQIVEGENRAGWESLARHMKDLFEVTLNEPEYLPETGDIQMSYIDRDGIELDLTSSGRGLQQTLLLLAYLELHPGAILLLDEPDAHLEILRQGEIYLRLRESARQSGSQLVIASHSEEILNQAASLDSDSVVAFLGRPHRIPGNRTAAVKSALNAVRYDQYYQAEQLGWVLYLEDYTDLEILRAFAQKLNHPAQDALQLPFVYRIGNVMKAGRNHFNALREAKQDLVGFLLVDSDAKDPQAVPGLTEMRWTRREIENYICQPETLLSFARSVGKSMAEIPLAESSSIEAAEAAMREAYRYHLAPAQLANANDDGWITMKAGDQFLDKVFPDFYRRIGRYMDMRKADYFRLVPHIPDDLVADEVKDVLGRIHEVATHARPVGEGALK